MRKILAILLTIIMMMSVLAACNDNNNDNTTPSNVISDAKDAEYDASVYMIDSWRKDLEDGKREYYITLLMYSADYYDCPTVEDVRYETDNGCVPITEAIDGAEVTVYHANIETKRGICSYAKIKTSMLIDTKKIYVLLEGPSAYIEGVTTKDEYKAIKGSYDGWRALLANVSSGIIPHTEVDALQSSIDDGVIRLYSSAYDHYYYSSEGSEPIVDGNAMLTKIFVDPLGEGGVDILAKHLSVDARAVNIVDGVPQMAELDKRLKIVSKIIDGELWVGFETVDESNFSEYDGEIPNAIAYSYGKTSCFVVN